MLNFIQWSVDMARKLKKAVRRLPANWPRVQLIPAPEDSASFELRKQDTKSILAALFASAHKRGRPKKRESEEEFKDAA